MSRYVVLGGGRVGVRLGRYDRRRGVVIDPVLAYSTYLGGSSTEEARGLAVDAAGEAYFAGRTWSDNFPATPGAFQTTFGGTQDAIVAKLNASGSALVYATYLGGSSSDYGLGVAVDAAGDAYATGATMSHDFPTTPGAYQETRPASGDANDLNAFVTKLNATGSALEYSTYLGGSSTEEGYGIAVEAGDVYVTGDTYSDNFPVTPGAFQPTINPAGGNDAFVAKLNLAGHGASDLVYSTFLGGSGNNDWGLGVAVDAAGDAYVAGYTNSPDFPTTLGAFQTGHGGNTDAFVTKLNPAGYGASSLVYSTYLGGGSSDAAYGQIAVDAVGDVYVSGVTYSSDFPLTPGALQDTYAGGGDAFVVKLNPAGHGLSDLVYSTFLGGGGLDMGVGVAVDAAGDAYATGLTSSSDFPLTADAVQSTNAGGGADAFVAKLDAAGSGLMFSSYLGGGGYDYGQGVAVDVFGDVYVDGGAGSGFPVTPGAAQTTYGGGFIDAFVAKFMTRPAPEIVLAKTASVDEVRPGGTVSYTITVHNRGPLAVPDVEVSDDLSGLLDRSRLVGRPRADTGTVTVTGQQLTWTGTLAAGQTARITYEVRVHDGLHGGMLFNGVSGPIGSTCAGGGDPHPPCVTETRIVPPKPPTPGPDLQLTKSVSPQTVHPAGEVTYVLVVHNRGPGKARHVMLEDPAPSGVFFRTAHASHGHCTINRALVCHLGDLPAGGQALVQVTATIAADAHGALVNRSSVWGNRGEANESHNAATSTVHVTPPPPTPAEPPLPGPGAQPISDLVLTKHVDRHRVRQGQRLRYTLRVANHGPDAARHVRLTDTPRLPVRIVSVHAGQGRCRRGTPLTCTLGTLRSGAHTTIRITAVATTAGVQTNTAAVRSTSTDTHPATNVAAARARITAVRPAPRPKRPKPPPKRPKPPPPRFTG